MKDSFLPVLETIIEVCTKAIILIAIAGYLKDKGTGIEMITVYGFFISYFSSQVLRAKERIKEVRG